MRRRLCLLVCALLLAAGCVTPADKAQWDEAMKEWRGDNMKMRGDARRLPMTP
ncbi:MAG TPA: hypothetical protein VKD72_12310 [Gemmataceae bacterium]|nr:hypothetical protein [Gemmataceae bacterium]